MAMQNINLLIFLFLLLPLLLLGQRKSKSDAGWKHHFSAYYQGGISDTDEFLFGTALRYGLDYDFGNRFRAGLMTGIENFNISEGELIFPVMATLTYDMRDEKMIPFVQMGLGYSLADMFTNKPVLEAKGGLGGDIQVGYRIPIKGKTSLSTGIGFRYQQATFTSRQIFDDNDVVKREYQYRRLYWNIGLNF
jgi:hypothetical protein